MTPILSSTLLRTQSDARLAFLAAQGHERAFEAIVERYRRPLHRYCRRILPEARAEDAVQQAFMKAWSALDGGTRVDDLKPWLYRIAHNVALDAAKKSGYDYDELSDSVRLAPGAHEDLERRAVIRETLAGVAALPANQREALLRTVVEGHSRAAIAADLNVTEGAVRQLVHRARLTLRAAATALTPLPLASWAAAFNGASDAPSTAQRIAELAGTGGSAGAASVLLKAGAVVVATGALAAGPPGTALRHAVSTGHSTAKATQTTGDQSAAGSGKSEDSRRASGDGRGERRRGDHGRSGSRRTGVDEHGRPLVADVSHRGPGPGGLGMLDDHRSSGTSGSSGSGHDGSGSSGSGSGGSSHDGSGSSGSGSGTSTSSDGGGSGTGSGDLGSGSSGSGSGDGGTTTTSGSGGSGTDGGSTSGSDGGHDGLTTTTAEPPH